MNKLKGVILAGGTGSRLFPITKVTNKHLLPVGRKPMIFHPIEKMAEAGVTDILIVTGVEHMGAVVGLLGSGKQFNCDFTYRVQDEAGGISQALYLARDFVGDDRMIVILGDNLFEDNLADECKAFLSHSGAARIFLKEVTDPQRFGVAEIVGFDVVRIEEKPASPKSNLAVAGVYLFDNKAFKFIETLKPSARGELEITDVLNAYIADKNLQYSFLFGQWTDAGTFESLKRANELFT